MAALTLKKAPSAGSASQGKAVVLGPERGVSLRIARDLEALGIPSQLPGLSPGLSDDRLPGVSDPNAPEALRDLFRDFASREIRYIHPGLSSWAERPEFPTLAQQCGLTPLAPSPKAIALFGNKLSLFDEAEKIGIPNLVIDSAPMHSHREIEAFVRQSEQRLPFVLKAAKGGSRYGLTVIHETAELSEKLPLWIEQLRKNCGEVILFAERYLEGARCISVAFARMPDGATRIFPFVDSTLQCRHRKVIEFCPADCLSPEIEKRIRKWTEQMVARCGYIGVGALEFLVESDRAYLIGGVPRLNAAFHLWESVAGTSAVAWQVSAYVGAPTPSDSTQDPEWPSGLSIRLYAEDSVFQLPQPGVIHEVSERTSWELESGRGELDLNVGAGDEITAEQQGWIGTLWAGGRDRAHVIRLARDLIEDVWVAGSIQTNGRFLSELLAHSWVREGVFHAGFVDEEFLPSLRPTPEVLKLFASVLATEPLDSGERWAIGDQWIKPDPAAVAWERGPEIIKVGELAGVSGILKDGLRVCAYPLAENRWQVRIGSWVLVARRVKKRPGEKVQARISSLVAGKIHSLLFQEGAWVQAHEPLLIIESLGIFIPHALPVDVRIHRWKVKPEQKVYAGQDLADFEILAKS